MGSTRAHSALISSTLPHIHTLAHTAVHSMCTIGLNGPSTISHHGDGHGHICEIVASWQRESKTDSKRGYDTQHTHTFVFVRKRNKQIEIETKDEEKNWNERDLFMIL